MVRCEHCGRHHMTHETSCPFCRRGGSTLGKKIRNAAAVASTMVLMACYAPGSMYVDTDLDDTALADVDDDGYNVNQDCDDGDAAVNPAADEICDDTIDNDCDGLIDIDDLDDCPVP